MPAVAALVCLLFGLVVGSFLNVVVHRVPRGTFFSGGRRSHCPACGATIRWYDNLPVLSWLLLRGTARCCGARISIRYPLIEALTGAAFVGLWFVHRSQIVPDSGTLSFHGLALFGVDAALAGLLIAASAIDLEFRILPTSLNLIGFGLGVAAAVLLPDSMTGSWLAARLEPSPPAARALITALAGSALGAGALYSIAWIGARVYGTEAMGLGDVKFMAFTGAFLGPGATLLALLLACLLGAVIGLAAALRTGDPRIPFGPFLAIGVAAARFGRAPLATWVLRDWPHWLQTSPYAPFVLLGLALLSLFALFSLRRLRRKGSGD